MNIVTDAIKNIEGILYGPDNYGNRRPITLFTGCELDSIIPAENISYIFKRLHLDPEYLNLPSDSYIWVRRCPDSKIHITGIHCDEKFRRSHGDELCGKDNFKFLIDVVTNPNRYGVILQDIVFRSDQVVTQEFAQEVNDLFNNNWSRLVQSEQLATDRLELDGIKYKTEVVDRHLDLLTGKYYFNSLNVSNLPAKGSILDMSIKYDDTFQLLPGDTIPFNLLRKSSFRYNIDIGSQRFLLKRYTRVQIAMHGFDQGESDQLCMIDDSGRNICRTYSQLRGDFLHIDLNDLNKELTFISGYTPQDDPVYKTVSLTPLDPDTSKLCLLLITLASGKFLSIRPVNNTIYEEGNFRILNGNLLAGVPIKSITAYYEITY